MQCDTLVDRYFAAFAAGDLDAVAALLVTGVTLQDPFVGVVQGKPAVLEVYRNLFRAARLDLSLERRFRAGATAAVEFSLRIHGSDGKVSAVKGVDLIETARWGIVAIRAYVEVVPA